MGVFYEQFRYTLQQDSHELLTILIDELHSDLKTLKVEVIENIFLSDSYCLVIIFLNNSAQATEMSLLLSVPGSNSRKVLRVKLSVNSTDKLRVPSSVPVVIEKVPPTICSQI